MKKLNLLVCTYTGRKCSMFLINLSNSDFSPVYEIRSSIKVGNAFDSSSVTGSAPAMQ
jgi:hypothetical protein